MQIAENGAYDGDVDVAIVGAGAAGLMAARVLSRAGFRVAIFEARDRAGGRVYTRADDAAGAPIEYGPEFVHGLPRVSLELLRESGDSAVDNGETSFVFENGRFEEAREDRFAAAEALLERGNELDEDCSVEELLERAVRDGASRTDAEHTRALVAGFDAADPARASARAIAEEWTGDASAEGAQSRPIRGYGRLIAHLLRALDPARAAVRFSSVVSRVELVPGGVVLDVCVRGNVGRVRARAAIVTIPLGVLHAAPGDAGAIAFSPALPAAHVRALAHLAMGPVRKVIMQFAEAFWETIAAGTYRDGAFFTTQGPFPAIWTQVPVRARTLTAWAGGPDADALAALDRDAAIALALESVVTLFDAPQARELLVHGYDHDWQRDPYSRGAYSYALVGAGDARDVLGTPIAQRLVIAGEATARGSEGGTVAGALESGERAARALLAALRAR